ncbi:transporter, putative [Pseudozyma hubeiensis SY62]|uniref:Transporter, putative n=1 Tax=Pseudozyma hubeiensis (strain SY62) TaxID=1305764 RepID=R9PII6_PSEHS|nr:transporter, putative [Pseudozyma hubeiensis SY62]GAC97895.1 transporter, putative [Pseudozyma hubeiensis SY62]
MTYRLELLQQLPAVSERPRCCTIEFFAPASWDNDCALTYANRPKFACRPELIRCRSIVRLWLLRHYCSQMKHETRQEASTRPLLCPSPFGRDRREQHDSRQKETWDGLIRLIVDMRLSRVLITPRLGYEAVEEQSRSMHRVLFCKDTTGPGASWACLGDVEM